jgi:hypothetical protein
MSIKGYLGISVWVRLKTLIIYHILIIIYNKKQKNLPRNKNWGDIEHDLVKPHKSAGQPKQIIQIEESSQMKSK